MGQKYTVSRHILSAQVFVNVLKLAANLVVLPCQCPAPGPAVCDTNLVQSESEHNSCLRERWMPTCCVRIGTPVCQHYCGSGSYTSQST